MKRAALLLVIIYLLISPCLADGDIMESVQNAVPEESRELIGTDNESTLEHIFAYFKEQLHSAFEPSVKKAVSIVCVALICAILGILNVSDKVPDCINLCGCAAISIISAGEVGSYLDVGTKALGSISDFSKALLPAMCTAGAACGKIGAASAKYAASALFTDIFVTAAQNLILPVIYAYLALGIAAAAFNNKSLAGISELFKWACTSLMVLLCLAFTAYLNISSAVASATDAVAAKAAKTVISSALPVVGSIISDAASSVVAGAELLKNTVGVFGMLAVLGICAGPFAALGINFLMYKTAALTVSALNLPKLSELIGCIGTAFGMILSLVGCGGIMLIISVMSCIRAVTVI